ncbi:MAG: glycosyltransferase [Candidatus Nanoarchaeia archaeon]
MKLSIIIPTYNEEENIVELLNKTELSLKGLNYKHEIIVVDDGTDATAALALKVAKSKGYPVKVHKRKAKRGLTSAILDGIKLSKGKLIAVMDADLQHPPEMLPELLKEIEKGNDIAIASRYVKGASSSLSLYRKFVSKTGVFILHLFVPKTRIVKDPLANFIVFKKEIVDVNSIDTNAIRLLPELLVRGKVKKVVELPYQFKSRKAGKTKVLSIRNMWAGLLYALRLGKKELARMGKFLIVGASGIAVNEGLLWLLTEFVGLFYLVSSIIAIETSILSNFILNDVWTFRDCRKGNFIKRLIKFNVARIATLAINFGMLFLLTTLGMHYLLSNLFGIALATIAGYLASVWWVWKWKKTKNLR